MATNNNLVYDDSTIKKTETEREQVRTRANVYFGNTDVRGALQAVLELVTNGADELHSGHGSYVLTKVEEDWDAIQAGDAESSYIVTVIDDGRGVPMDLNPETGRYNWDNVYNQMFASGKREGSRLSGISGQLAAPRTVLQRG